MQCFEDFLNSDTSFSNNYYLLNYGIGGYGVDQIAMLCERVVPMYDKPIVIFGMLTTDIDRSVLPLRGGQKGYVGTDTDGNLAIRGYPIYEDIDSWVEDNPYDLNWFLFRRLVYSNLNFLPTEGTEWLMNLNDTKEEIRAANKIVINKAANGLQKLNLPHTFLVFHFRNDFFKPDSKHDWRSNYMTEVLKQTGSPYILSRDLVVSDSLNPNSYRHEDYLIPGEGHPTSHFNMIIANEIKRFVLGVDLNACPSIPDHPLKYSVRISKLEAKIRNDEGWLALIKEKLANEDELDFAIYDNAVYSLYTEK